MFIFYRKKVFSCVILIITDIKMFIDNKQIDNHYSGHLYIIL